MKKFSYYPLSICVLLIMTLSSCKVIGDIFSAGIWFGVIGVVVVVGLIVWLVGRGGGSK
jgi:hypothetical protein